MKILGRFVNEMTLRKVQFNNEDISVVNNRIATKGAKSSETVFIDVTAWRNVAEYISKFSKGDEILFDCEFTNKKNKVGDKSIDIPALVITKIHKIWKAENKEFPDCLS